MILNGSNTGGNCGLSGISNSLPPSWYSCLNAVTLLVRSVSSAITMSPLTQCSAWSGSANTIEPTGYARPYDGCIGFAAVGSPSMSNPKVFGPCGTGHFADFVAGRSLSKSLMVNTGGSFFTV